VISDSFKAVVTIYILIPFLVIPQIILSGIIVKFEELNPNISSPSKIPFYGEFIVARWGYEALAVKQFMDNDYEKQFYYYDKAMSMSNIKKIWWNDQLKTIIAKLKSEFEKGNFDEEFKANLLILRNEINLEMQIIPELEFTQLEQLIPERITLEAIEAAGVYVETVRQTYIKYYNKMNAERDALMTQVQEIDKEGFFELKDQQTNNQLEEFVRNSNEKESYVAYDGRLIQKVDPIYKDPEQKFLKAHFYAPRKQLFGSYFPTFWVNIGVLWLNTLLLYFVLFFRLGKRLLDFMEELSERSKNKNPEK
jgi:hypothetical protein